MFKIHAIVRQPPAPDDHVIYVNGLPVTSVERISRMLKLSRVPGNLPGAAKSCVVLQIEGFRGGLELRIEEPRQLVVAILRVMDACYPLGRDSSTGIT